MTTPADAPAPEKWHLLVIDNDAVITHREYADPVALANDLRVFLAEIDPTDLRVVVFRGELFRVSKGPLRSLLLPDGPIPLYDPADALDPEEDFLLTED